MKQKYIIAHLRAAHVYAELSYCKRLQVGCVITKDTNILAYGYNGTPSGWENNCEDEDGNSHSYVYHAEVNAINKLAQTHGNGKGSSVFLTHAPCLNCALQLANLGIKELFFTNFYRCSLGIEFLKSRGIPTEQILLD